MDIFPTADGWLGIIGGATGPTRYVLYEVLGRPDLIEAFPQSAHTTRADERAALFPLIGEAMSARPTAEWCKRFTEAGIRWAPVRDYHEVIADRGMWTNGYFLELELSAMADGAATSVVGTPVRFERHAEPGCGRCPRAGPAHGGGVARDRVHLGRDRGPPGAQRDLGQRWRAAAHGPSRTAPGGVGFVSTPILMKVVFLHGIGDGDPEYGWLTGLNRGLAQAGHAPVDRDQVIAPRYGSYLDRWALGHAAAGDLQTEGRFDRPARIRAAAGPGTAPAARPAPVRTLGFHLIPDPAWEMFGACGRPTCRRWTSTRSAATFATTRCAPT